MILKLQDTGKAKFVISSHVFHIFFVWCIVFQCPTPPKKQKTNYNQNGLEVLQNFNHLPCERTWRFVRQYCQISYASHCESLALRQDVWVLVKIDQCFKECRLGICQKWKYILEINPYGEDIWHFTFVGSGKESKRFLYKKVLIMVGQEGAIITENLLHISKMELWTKGDANDFEGSRSVESPRSLS